MPVNGRCTDGKSRVVDWKAMGNLFRAPKAFQALDNIPVHKSTGFQRSSRLAALFSANSIKNLSPPMVVPVTIVWLVLWLLTGTIPPNLSADRRGASAQKAGNFPYTVRLCCLFYFPCCTYNDNLSTSPAGGGKCTCVKRGKVCGKAKLEKLHLTTKFSSVHGRKLGSPSGRAVERSETERAKAGAQRLRGEKPLRSRCSPSICR